MFVGNLNETQQSALLFLADKIIVADGAVSTEELSVLSFIAAQCTTHVEKMEIDFSTLATIFPDQRSKSSLMLEILGLVYADNKCHENETGLVKEIAYALSITAEELGDMENWVKRQFLMVKEAQTFLEE